MTVAASDGINSSSNSSVIYFTLDSTAPAADITYPIVNLADFIANRLYRHYNKMKNTDNTRYIDYLITPRIQEYKGLLNSFR